MKQALSRPKDRILRESKKEEGAGDAKETDPLLAGADGRPRESHHRGSVRSRHCSRSPALRDSQMDPGMHDDRYTVNNASETYNSTDAYVLHNDTESAGNQAQHTGLEESSFNTRSTTTPSTTSDERRAFHLRRTKPSYRPPNSDHSSQQPLNDEGEPPLLEIPEEVYAVRKAALQVMKPLIGSWVSPLKPFFYLTPTTSMIFWSSHK
jgi:hypothetical protein